MLTATRNTGGGGIWHCGRKLSIMSPDTLKEISFDYCLIAVHAYKEVVTQCLENLKVSEEKLLVLNNLFQMDMNLVKSIFTENVFGNPRSYNIDGVCIDLGEGHNLPAIQKAYKMYDKIFPYIGEMTMHKKGKVIVDIGANVGDTLAAMWKHTDDHFIEIEPVKEFFNLLVKNVDKLGITERVCAERAFITDNIEESYQVKLSKGGTAHKERIDIDAMEFIPSQSIDGLIKEKGIAYEEVDFLKIDTDGFDADCILAAKELLKRGSALLYWENYVETVAQYQKYKEAYALLNKENYTSFFIFDNWGNFLCKGDTNALVSVMDYVRRTYSGCIGNTFTYFDVLACKPEDTKLCENMIKRYVEKYPLWRIV